MLTVQTALLDIAYLSGGPENGAPLLLLHGWPDDVSGWATVTPALEAAGYRWFAPWLRGFGPTRFRLPDTIRDASSVAIAQDALDFADALGLDRFAVLGHDWGGRAAYAMAALSPERLMAIAVLAIGYTPHGRYEVPSFAQCRRWWYQWLMTSEAGAATVSADPIGFARAQWESWSPPGWYAEDSFSMAAESFRNPDWLAITLHGYRHRWQSEALDPRYAEQRMRIGATERLSVPMLMIQGGDDRCDPPEESEGQERFFTASYERLVIDNIGHFPAREAAQQVGDAILRFLTGFPAEQQSSVLTV
ncbi:alpha/beta hydrolase [Sphingomonas sp. BIUV-7]|uniref:Alpha/beta hydrolase n=1 Tax=Sphingomonas natans TaxID=3063330 RepID=A0ABT8Y8H9_9SPHN|nr:alpha/beta hydrolase [Sphingomonas sp. BIUV-7]MDO6414282.1 alpha/beta hydrolase [Sphingomonas sp. BIUV-7]